MNLRWMSATRRLVAVAVSRLVRFFSSFLRRIIGTPPSEQGQISPECRPSSGEAQCPAVPTRISHTEPESVGGASECRESMGTNGKPPAGSHATTGAPSSCAAPDLALPSQDAHRHSGQESSLVVLQRCLAERPEMLASLLAIGGEYKPEGYLALPEDPHGVLNLHS